MVNVNLAVFLGPNVELDAPAPLAQSPHIGLHRGLVFELLSDKITEEWGEDDFIYIIIGCTEIIS